MHRHVFHGLPFTAEDPDVLARISSPRLTGRWGVGVGDLHDATSSRGNTLRSSEMPSSRSSSE